MARLTRAMIYKSFGIEFKKGKIFHPVLGWINPLLVNGNEKIGKGIWHFSTLPTNEFFEVYINFVKYVLKGTCPCHCVGCYATSGNYNYQNVKDSLGVKTWLVYNDLDYVKKAIQAQIIADKIEFVRIHASGDFFSMEYVGMWHDIAKENAGVTFWTYTKLKQAENAFDDLPNANIVKSVIPHKGVNYGHCDYILALYEYLTGLGKKVYICRCGIDKSQHCTNCKGCSKNDYVLFLEHSTGYKAEKDALFPVLKKLIESQPKQ